MLLDNKLLLPKLLGRAVGPEFVDIIPDETGKLEFLYVAVSVVVEVVVMEEADMDVILGTASCRL